MSSPTSDPKAVHEAALAASQKRRAELVKQHGERWQNRPPSHPRLAYADLAVYMRVRVRDIARGDWTATVTQLYRDSSNTDRVVLVPVPGQPKAPYPQLDTSSSELGMNPSREGRWHHWMWLEPI